METRASRGAHDGAEMDLYDVMHTTFAAREFTDEPVAPAVVERLIEHARFAPSGGNRQGWNVIDVRARATREALVPLFEPAMRRYLAQWQHGEVPWNPVRETALDEQEIAAVEVPPEMLALYLTAPVLLVVTIDLGAVAAMDQHLDRVGLVAGASVYPFVWNLLLAARNEGLGGTLTTLLVSREPEARAVLGIPEHVAIAAVLPIGRPVKQLTKLLLDYPQIIDVHFWAQFPGEPVDSGSRRIEYIAQHVLPEVRKTVGAVD